MIAIRVFLRIARLVSLSLFMLMQSANAQVEGLLSRGQAKAVNEETVGIVIGSQQRYHHEMVGDLSRILDEPGKVRIVPVLSKHNVQRIYDMLYMTGIDASFVHSDVLPFMERYGLEPGVSSRINYIAKMFDEEVHLLARKKFTAIDQLSGQRVNIGTPGSGNHMSGSLFFDHLGIQIEPVDLGSEEALDRLKAGDIAAMVWVTRKPNSSIASLTPEDGIKILSIPSNPELKKIYMDARITHDDYANLISVDEPVNTLSIGLMFASYKWSQDSWRYKKLARFNRLLIENWDRFQQQGSKNWQEIDMLAQVPGWQRSPILNEWVAQQQRKEEEAKLARAMEADRLRNEMLVKIQQQLAKAENPEALFDQFAQLFGGTQAVQQIISDVEQTQAEIRAEIDAKREAERFQADTDSNSQGGSDQASPSPLADENPEATPEALVQQPQPESQETTEVAAASNDSAAVEMDVNEITDKPDSIVFDMRATTAEGVGDSVGEVKVTMVQGSEEGQLPALLFSLNMEGLNEGVLEMQLHENENCAAAGKPELKIASLEVPASGKLEKHVTVFGATPAHLKGRSIIISDGPGVDAIRVVCGVAATKLESS